MDSLASSAAKLTQHLQELPKWTVRARGKRRSERKIIKMTDKRWKQCYISWFCQQSSVEAQPVWFYGICDVTAAPSQALRQISVATFKLYKQTNLTVWLISSLNKKCISSFLLLYLCLISVCLFSTERSEVRVSSRTTGPRVSASHPRTLQQDGSCHRGLI